MYGQNSEKITKMEINLSNEEYEMTTMIVKGADMVNYTAIILNPLESLMLSYKKL